MPSRSCVNAILESLACPKCGAGNGEHCVTGTGKRATWPHAARYFAACRAGLLPLEDGTEGSEQ